MSVRSPIALKFCRSYHCGAETCIATHGFVIVSKIIRITATVLRIHFDIGIAIGAIQAHAHSEAGRNDDVHDGLVVMHTGQRILTDPSLPHQHIWQIDGL